jgi:hypothetical protein
MPPASPPHSHHARQRTFLFIALAVGAYLTFRIVWLGKFMVHVDDILPLAECLRLRANPYYLADIVALSTRYTYPPGQFFLSLPLASLTADFHAALILYRLPSLLIWLAGLFGLYRLLRQLLPTASALILAVPVMLGLFSWRGFVESSQGYSSIFPPPPRDWT